MRLNVSAPFHSRFMRSVEEAFAGVLQASQADFYPQKAVNVTSNYTGKFHAGIYEELIQSLTFQLGQPVLWKENMVVLSREAEKIYEVGPARNLGEGFKTLNINCKSVISFETAQNIFTNES